MIRFAPAAALLLISASGFAMPLDDPAPDRVQEVQVQGHRFKVEVAGTAVRVIAQPPLRLTIPARDAMRAAVREATGCTVVDDLWPMDGRFRGRLAC